MPDKLISDAAAVLFATDFIDAYLNPSFGSLPKREVDIRVFSLLYQNDAFGGATDLQSISRILKISPARVRTLMRDMDLRDRTKGFDWFKGEVRRALAAARVMAEGKLILLGIERDILRTEVEAYLKRDGFTPDYGTNREILKIDFTIFAKFVADLSTAAEKDRLRAAFRKAGGDVDLTTAEAIQSAIVATLTKTIGDAAGKTLEERAIQPLSDWCGEAIGGLLKEFGARLG